MAACGTWEKLDDFGLFHSFTLIQKLHYKHGTLKASFELQEMPILTLDVNEDVKDKLVAKVKEFLSSW